MATNTKSAPTGGNLTVDVRVEVERDLMAYKADLASYLGKVIDPERFVKLAVKTIVKSPDLLRCDKLSLQVAVLDAAGLQLEIDGPLGHAYVVPYKGKAQFQIGYKGYNELMTRTGKVRPRHCAVVYKGDKWEYDDGATRVCKHQPCPPSQRELDPNGQPIEIAAYSVVDFTDAKGRTLETDFEWMWAEEVEAIRRRSPAGNSGPWITDRAEMVKKTVRRRHAKRMPLGSEASRALAYEEQFDAGLEPGSYRASPREVEVEVVQPAAAEPPAKQDGDPALRKRMAEAEAKKKGEKPAPAQTGYGGAEPRGELAQEEVAAGEDRPSDPPKEAEPRVVHGIPIRLVKDPFPAWKDETIPTASGHPFFEKTWKQIETYGRQGDEPTLKLLRAAVAGGLQLLSQKKLPGELYERAALTLEAIELNSGKDQPPVDGEPLPFG